MKIISKIVKGDKGILVGYLQNYLNTYYPKLKVTGTYDDETYRVLADFMFRIYPNEKYPYVWNSVTNEWEDFSGDFDEVVEHNIEASKIDVSNRVLSYIFEEVVTEQSSKEEIYRVQKLIYRENDIPVQDIGKYSTIVDKVLEVQRDLLKYGEGKFLNANYVPERYYGFKDTGYVDPWTEVLLIEEG